MKRRKFYHADPLLTPHKQRFSPWKIARSCAQICFMPDDFLIRPKWVVPGNSPDADTHAAMSLMRGPADELDLPVHVHPHERRDEIRRSLAAHGVRPLEGLRKPGLLGPGPARSRRGRRRTWRRSICAHPGSCPATIRCRSCSTPQAGRMSAMSGYPGAAWFATQNCKTWRFSAWTPAPSCGKMRWLVQTLDTNRLFEKSERSA